MKTTILFDYKTSVNYATNLFRAVDANNEAYKLDKRTEALMILIGIDTGLRISDLLNLKYSNLEESGEYGKPLIHTYIKKTKKEITIPITFTTKHYIDTYKNWINLVYGESEYIFFNFHNNKTYTRGWAHKRISQANDKGLLGDKVTVAGAHSLRKTAANRVYEVTKDIRDAQYLLGHRNITQTETYLKIDQKKALQRLCDMVY